MTSYRSLSRNRDFTALWTGEAISQLGSAVSMFAFSLVGYALTGSAMLAGLADGGLHARDGRARSCRPAWSSTAPTASG